MLAEWVQSSIFNEVAALLVLAAAVGFAGLALRQPLIVSFIAVGILAGPAMLDIAQSPEPIDLLADLGIAVLLFLVGIKLDLKLVRTLGPVALATGLGQVAFTSLFGYLICLALGLTPLTSLYVAVALTFSSTIIIVKLLSDKREIDSLHGRIALGFLIVQDLVVVLAMIVLSAVGIGEREGSAVGDVVRVLGSSIALLAAVLLFIRYLANPLTRLLAQAPELLVGFAIALAAAFAATGQAFGFGKELGGLLAGVALASTPFRDAIASRLAPLRDFLLLFFFIALGASLDLGELGARGFEAAVLSAFVLIGNPVIVLLIMAWLGYRPRTGFLAGLTVAQISEFSLIFMAMGVALGHVTTDALALVTLVGLVTISASTYMITYSHELWDRFEPLLGRLKPRGPSREGYQDADSRTYDAIVMGLGRYGGTIARRLAEHGFRVLGVDFNPEAVRRWREEGGSVLFGDASDPELVAGLPLANVRWVVATMPHPATGVSHYDSRLAVLQSLSDAGYDGRIAVATQRAGEAEMLRDAGADLILRPYPDAAERAYELIIGASDDPVGESQTGARGGSDEDPGRVIA
jgi:Kef-type K+ transport system membrane component KefB